MRRDCLPTLDYAAPGAFFEGAYLYRSWNGVMSSGVTAGIGAGLLFARNRIFARLAPDPTLWWIAQGLGLLGVAALLAAGVTLAFVLQARQRVVRITEHGITHGRRHWPWVRIALFGGMKYSNGVAITFQLSGRGHGTRTLITTPLLTVEQFAELAKTVKAFASEPYPHLSVMEKPEIPTGD